MPDIWIGAAANALNYSMEIAMKQLLDQENKSDLYPLSGLNLTVKEYSEVIALIYGKKLKAVNVAGVCLVRDSRGVARERPDYAVRGTLAVEGQQLLRSLRSPRPDELPTLEELQKLSPRQFDARYRQSVQAAQAAATPMQTSAQAAAPITGTLPKQEAEDAPQLLDLELGA